LTRAAGAPAAIELKHGMPCQVHRRGPRLLCIHAYPGAPAAATVRHCNAYRTFLRKFDCKVHMHSSSCALQQL
jgi:hypothetical protein